MSSYHAECLAQLAMFTPAREVLVQDQSVMAALEAVAEIGTSADSREHAAAALLALSDKQLQVATEGQKHIMISYQVRDTSVCLYHVRVCTFADLC
eukprot:COSAG02_NODE_6699_length_3414_cov_8.770437_5_plen_96_part_00